MEHGRQFIMMGFGVFVALLMACSTSLAGGLSSFLGGVDLGGVDPADFERRLTDGSKAYLSALAEFSSATGEVTQAKSIQAFLEKTPSPWDAPTLKTALTKAKGAKVSSDAEIIPLEDIASAHIINSWVLATYAAHMYKEAASDARKIVSKGKTEDISQTNIELAAESSKVLPSYIKTATTIVKTSTEYMSKAGIAKPSTAEITQMLTRNLGSVKDEVVRQIF